MKLLKYFNQDNPKQQYHGQDILTLKLITVKHGQEFYCSDSFAEILLENFPKRFRIISERAPKELSELESKLLAEKSTISRTVMEKENQFRAKISELEAKISKSTSEITGLNEKLAGKEAEIQALNIQLQQFRNRLIQKDELYSELEKKLEKLEQPKFPYETKLKSDSDELSRKEIMAKLDEAGINYKKQTPTKHLAELLEKKG